MARLGKGAIENLTQGMYTDSRIVYREYIQNACDQIDILNKSDMYSVDEKEKAEIIITIDPVKRNVFVMDNATGVSVKDIKRNLEDVADSNKKQGENKGFRGIGRLGGVAYCKELRFVTSYKGETIETTMIWNAQKIQEIIWDENNHSSAEEIIDNVVSYSTKEVDADKHYFEVQMIGINHENDKLLDCKNIRQYISEVAPVDFKKTFMYRSLIREFINNHDEIPPLDCYKIGIREKGKDLSYISKECPMSIYKMVGKERIAVDTIEGIHADVIYDTQGEAIAWIWYAISCFNGVINDIGNPWKGLRLRQFNIQIGDKTTLAEFFKEGRGNSYFIGEVHTISTKLRPNARRDYFNETAYVKDFEYAIKEYFKSLYDVYKAGSDINSGYKSIYSAKDKFAEYNRCLQSGFSSPEAKKRLEVELEKLKEKADEGIRRIKKYRKFAKENTESAVAQVYRVIAKKHKDVDVDKIVLEVASGAGISELPKKSRHSENSEKSTKYNNGNNGAKPFGTREGRKPLTETTMPAPVPDSSAASISTPASNGVTASSNGNSKTNPVPPQLKKDKPKLLVDELSFLDKKTRKIISKIYDVINKNMIYDEANDLIGKIHKELKESQ